MVILGGEGGGRGGNAVVQKPPASENVADSGTFTV